MKRKFYFNKKLTIMISFLLVIFLFFTFYTTKGYTFNNVVFSNIVELFKNNKSQNIYKNNKAFLSNDDLLKPNPLPIFTEIPNNEGKFSLNNDATFNVYSGSIRASTEKDNSNYGAISIYEVKSGDTLGSIAKLFNVSKNTIIWANNLTDQKINLGDTLLIFPMNGIEYKVNLGGSVYDIAKKYNADPNEIAEYNGISVNKVFQKGDILFIPNAEMQGEIADENDITKETTKPSIKSIVKNTIKNIAEKIVKTGETINNVIAGYYMMPVSGCVKTQGLHGPYRTGVDYGCKVGTKVVASADGTIIRSSSQGYNGGYGEVVIISHPNNTQTIYAHLSKVLVSTGEKVKQGETIGETGNTGLSTGPHIHFETRGTSNPF